MREGEKSDAPSRVGSGRGREELSWMGVRSWGEWTMWARGKKMERLGCERVEYEGWMLGKVEVVVRMLPQWEEVGEMMRFEGCLDCCCLGVGYWWEVSLVWTL